MVQTTLEARQQMLDTLAEATDEIGLALASLGAAYEQLDVSSADELEEELFRPVQLAYGRARRTHTEFAGRHGLPSREFEPSSRGPSVDRREGLHRQRGGGGWQGGQGARRPPGLDAAGGSRRSRVPRGARGPARTGRQSRADERARSCAPSGASAPPRPNIWRLRRLLKSRASRLRRSPTISPAAPTARFRPGP